MTFPNLIILKPPRSPYRKPCVHQAARLLACVKTADLLTIAQFSGMTCVKKRFIAHITTVFTTAAASAVTWISVMDISSARCIAR